MIKQISTSFASAVIFYTKFPLPASWTNAWTRIARWSSLIGLIIGGLLGLSDFLLQIWGFSPLTRGVLITTLWLGITGGLHLDGAMDTADGLAVLDRQKRLEVMKDSATGAFGVMIAIIVILLKIVAFSEITHNNCLYLMLAAGWARWGQLMAIALYPYARETGKGAFHKENLNFVADISLGSIFVLFSSISGLLITAFSWEQILIIITFCAAIAIIIGYYFYRQLEGHTGDTYGAVVEWSEAVILLFLSRF